MKFRDTFPLTDEQVALIESENGWTFPQAYMDFLGRHNGGVPDVNMCAVGDNQDCRVTGFIPADGIKEEARFIENLSENAIPIAWAECGNYVLMEMSGSGAIRYWDHEEPTRDVVLAETFSGFIGALREFSLEELPPHKVIRVWIDPEFAKTLK